MTVNSLQVHLEALNARYDKILWMAQFKEVSGLEAEREIIRMYDPKLKTDCLLLIERLTDATLEFGHSAGLDQLKNQTMLILGRCLGEEL